MAQSPKMNLTQALTIAALVLEFEAESTDRQIAPGWINECLEAAQRLRRVKAELRPGG